MWTDYASKGLGFEKVVAVTLIDWLQGRGCGVLATPPDPLSEINVGLFSGYARFERMYSPCASARFSLCDLAGGKNKKKNGGEKREKSCRNCGFAAREWWQVAARAHLDCCSDYNFFWVGCVFVWGCFFLMLKYGRYQVCLFVWDDVLSILVRCKCDVDCECVLENFLI